MAIPPKSGVVLPPKAPNLPLAPTTYNAQYQDQFANVLRLYFNQIDNLAAQYVALKLGTMAFQNADDVDITGGSVVASTLGVMTGDTGAGGAKGAVPAPAIGDATKVLYGDGTWKTPIASDFQFPYGSFYDTTSQHDGSTTIPYAVRLGQTAYSNGVTVTNRTFSGTGSIGPASTTMTITAVSSGRLYPAMLLSGANVTAGTYVYLQLTSTAANIVGTFNYASGGGVGTNTITLDNVTGLTTRQFVSGTGVPANTRITYIDTGTKTITLSANLTVQAAGAYTFKPWGYQGTYSVSPSQTAASATINGVLPSMITPAQAGLYNIQFSFQFSNTTNNVVHEVDVWFRKNDVDLPDSNSRFSIPGAHSGLNGQLIAALNFMVALDVGDVLEIVWHTDNSDVFIETIPAATSPIRPQTPSAIVTVSFVSALP